MGTGENQLITSHTGKLGQTIETQKTQRNRKQNRCVTKMSVWMLQNVNVQKKLSNPIWGRNYTLSVCGSRCYLPHVLCDFHSDSSILSFSLGF